VRSGDAQAGNVVRDVLDSDIVIKFTLVFQQPPVTNDSGK